MTAAGLAELIGACGPMYALVNRPASLGAVPRGLRFELKPRPAEGQAHHELARHGFMVCDRLLTAEELLSFELALVAEGDAMAILAKHLVDECLSRYASEYLEAADGDRDLFRGAVFGQLEKVTSGLRISLGSPELFVQLVREALVAKTQLREATV